MKSFYAHLVETEIIEQELDSLDLSSKEKEDLMYHIHSSVHYKILDVVLSELPEEHKKEFMEHVQHARHSELWEHLLRNTQGIEGKIKHNAQLLLEEFANDIKMMKSQYKDKD